MAQKHVLSKTPRTVLYSIGGAGIAVLIAAVVAEILSPGSVEQIRGATELVIAEIGLILAALAAAVPPILALLNLDDDEVEGDMEADLPPSPRITVGSFEDNLITTGSDVTYDDQLDPDEAQ